MNRIPHIVIVASYFYPKIGGLENYAYALGKTLHQSGAYRVSVVTSKYDGGGYAREVIDGMTVHRLPIWFTVSNTPINLLWYRSMKRIFAVEKPDIINLHAPVPYLVDMAALAAKRTPIVLTYHAGSMLKGKMPIDLLIGVYEKVCLRSFFKRANAIVAISQEFVQRTFPQFLYKTHFIPTGVDLKRFKKTPLPHTQRVTFVGRIEHSSSWKGIEQLLQAFSIVARTYPNATLELVGGGDAVEHYRIRAKELGIENSTVFAGPKLGNELVEAYERANVVVLPSTSDAEAFSLVLIEAMASGRPVIGTNIGGTPQVIENEKNGLLIAPNDPHALAGAIERILKDGELAKRLADVGAEKAKSFSWDIQARKYSDLFQKVLQQKTPALHKQKKITFLVSGSIRSNFSYRSLSLARSFAALGHDVSVIAPKADKYNDFTPEHITFIDGVKIVQPFQFTTKHLELNLIPYIFSATFALFREKSDLVYLYKPTPITFIGLSAKLFRHTEVIVDLDDVGAEVMKIEGHPWHQRKLVEWSEHACAVCADRLVVASTYLFDTYHRRFPRKPIHIVQNGVEGSWFSEVAPSEDPKRIVFLGSINRKNILEPLFDVMPDIVRSHPDVEVLIIGDGQFLPYFKEKAASLDLSYHFTFTGWLGLEEARAYLRAGDIGYNYMPGGVTTRAASNMKLPQYMSRGVVPLVSDIGDLPAKVDFGKAGYISGADEPAALKEALLRALEDTDRPSKARCARTFACENFSWDALAAGLYKWQSAQSPSML